MFLMKLLDCFQISIKDKCKTNLLDFKAIGETAKIDKKQHIPTS